MKYKVVEDKGMYMVMYKNTWYSRWKYVRSKNNPTLISIWGCKIKAQSYINFLPVKKIK
jgi:hypothetical protein